MAQAFKAVGAGNGFPYCLQDKIETLSLFRNIPTTRVLSNYDLNNANNVPLEDAMKLCWSIKSLSFGPASLDLGDAFQPRDLAYFPTLNNTSTFGLTGPDSSDFGRNEDFQIFINKAKFLNINDERKFYHGILFEYNVDGGDSEGRVKRSTIFFESIPSFTSDHLSSLNFENIQTVQLGDPPGSEGSVNVGTFQRTTQSVVTIDGFKFLKTTIETSEHVAGVPPATPTPNYLSLTSNTPSIDSFYTYE